MRVVKVLSECRGGRAKKFKNSKRIKAKPKVPLTTRIEEEKEKFLLARRLLEKKAKLIALMFSAFRLVYASGLVLLCNFPGRNYEKLDNLITRDPHKVSSEELQPAARFNIAINADVCLNIWLWN